MESKKIFILGTQSLTSSIDSTLRFGSDNEIVIPYPEGIIELSKIANQSTEKGKVAKKLLEYFSKFKITSLLSPKGVIQQNGSILRFEQGFRDKKFQDMDMFSSFDRRKIQIALGLKETFKNKKPVIIVSKRPGLKILISNLGLKVEEFRDDIFPTLEEQYKGRINCEALKSKIETFYENGSMEIKNIHNYQKYEFLPNMFLNISALEDKSVSAIGRYDAKLKKIVPLYSKDLHPFGITPKNAGQKMAQEALLQPPETAPIVIIQGEAGTGKTILTLAAALYKTLNDDKKYSQILITTPTETLRDENLGFLPGEFEEKFDPYLGGIMDNLKILLSNKKKKSKAKDSNDSGSELKNSKYTPKQLLENGTIVMQLIGHLRGRSIVDTIFIIDEAQNIEPEVIKSIVTRAGEGSKFVFLGCPTQIDNPDLNERYNGLVYLSEKMKDSEYCWQVTLEAEESVRSHIAYIAAKLL